jgi:flagellar hook-associated protein 3 FlgL
MRITPFIIFNQLTRGLSRALNLYNTQNDRLNSGKKINAPSDNPTGLMRTMDYRVSVNAGEQYKRNIDSAMDNVNFTSTVMTSVYNTVIELQKLVAKGKSTQEPQELANSADEAEAYRDMLQDLANTKIMNQYLFSGFKSETPPYDDAYVYQGDDGEVNVPVSAAGAQIPINISGNSAFSFTGALPANKQIGANQWAHYSQNGTEVTVVINDNSNEPPDPLDPSQTDSFVFSNVIQMAEHLRDAISNIGDADPVVSGNATARISALEDPFTEMQEQLMSVQTDLGGRVSSLNAHSKVIEQNTNTLHKAITSIEEADPVEILAQLRQTEVTLQALRESAARVLSQSLFDFLR